MATISSSLKMFDAMSGPLKSITQGMNMMMSTMQQMQKVTDRNTNIDKMLIAAKNKITSAEIEINKAIKDATDQQDKFNNSVNRGKKQTDGLLGSIKSMVATYLSIQGAKSAFGFLKNAVNDTLEINTDETKLAQVLNTRMGMGAEQIEKFNQRLKEMGRTGAVSYDALIAGAGEMATYMSDAEALLGTMDTMSNMAAAQYGASTTADQLYNLATGVGKVYSGQAGGLSRQGWILDDSDVKAFEVGSDMEKMKTLTDLAMDSYGKMNEVIANTPQGQIEAFNGMIKETSASIGNNLLPGFLSATDTIRERLTELIETGKMDSFFSGVGVAIAGLVNGFIWLADGVGWFINAVQQAWGVIAPILTAIAVVYLSLLIAKLWAMIPPLLAAAKVWVLTNLPILAVVAAIALVLFILNKLGIGADQILGFIGGLFGGLYATIYNYLASVWNYWTRFAEFFVNVFQHPIYSVKKLFVGLADTAINMIKSIAKVMDAVFGSDLAGTLQGLQDKMHDWLGEMPEGYKVIQELEMKSIESYAKSGYKTGSGIVSGLTGALDKFKVGGFGQFGNGTIADIGTVGEVGKIKDKVDISSEDLKMMRELAEMKNVQNYVSLQPSYSFGDTHVREESDIDTIVAKVADKLEQDIASSVDSVYV